MKSACTVSLVVDPSAVLQVYFGENKRIIIEASLSELYTYVKLGDFVLLLFLAPYNALRSILACFVDIL